MAPDVVYAVRPGDNNEELRYSLRSLVNIPHGRVWIAGHRPSWVTGVEHIPTPQGGGKRDNAWANLIAAAHHPDVSELFTYWNDDMYALAPLPHVPTYHGGPLAHHVETYRRKWPASSYTAMLAATLDYLGTDALTYDLHYPMSMHKGRLAQVIADLDALTPRPLWRTVYGNRHRIGGTPREDCKVYPHHRWRPPSEGDPPWLSTTDTSLRQVLKYLRTKFPNPCEYEDAGRVG